jgi:hypothetical protein
MPQGRLKVIVRCSRLRSPPHAALCPAASRAPISTAPRGSLFRALYSLFNDAKIPVSYAPIALLGVKKIGKSGGYTAMRWQTSAKNRCFSRHITEQKGSFGVPRLNPRRPVAASRGMA